MLDLFPDNESRSSLTYTDCIDRLPSSKCVEGDVRETMDIVGEVGREGHTWLTSA